MSFPGQPQQPQQPPGQHPHGMPQGQQGYPQQGYPQQAHEQQQYAQQQQGYPPQQQPHEQPTYRGGPGANGPDGPEDSGNNMNKYLMIGGGVIIALMLAFLAFTMFTGDDEESTNDSDTVTTEETTSDEESNGDENSDEAREDEAREDESPQVTVEEEESVTEPEDSDEPSDEPANEPEGEQTVVNSERPVTTEAEEAFFQALDMLGAREHYTNEEAVQIANYTCDVLDSGVTDLEELMYTVADSVGVNPAEDMETFLSVSAIIGSGAMTYCPEYEGILYQ